MRYILSILCFFAPLFAADSPQFRGPNRDGVFSDTGLLKAWPQDGPPEIWSIEGLGQGYASIAIKDGRLYTTGSQGEEGAAFAFDLSGKRLWRTSTGPEHHGSGYPGTRTTPTVDGDRVYLITSMGRVVCLEAASGRELWQVDTYERFGGGKKKTAIIPRWGIAESALIDGNHVIATPGGPDATLIALDKLTGKTIWTTKGLSDISGYCSPRMFDDGAKRQIVTMTGKSMVGVDPDDGRLMWRLDYPASWDIHAVSPLFYDGNIYVSDGYNKGGAMFSLNPDGKGVQPLWTETSLDIHHGGAVLVNGAIFGSASKGKWICLDAKTGKVLKTVQGVGKGAVVYADGMIYGYGESGKVGLFHSDPEKFDLISSFKITKGTGQHWAHPVISDGVLYIRRGDALMAFAIR